MFLNRYFFRNESISRKQIKKAWWNQTFSWGKVCISSSELFSSWTLHIDCISTDAFTLKELSDDFFILPLFLLPFILVDVAVGTDPSLPA